MLHAHQLGDGPRGGRSDGSRALDDFRRRVGVPAPAKLQAALGHGVAPWRDCRWLDPEGTSAPQSGAVRSTRRAFPCRASIHRIRCSDALESRGGEFWVGGSCGGRLRRFRLHTCRPHWRCFAPLGRRPRLARKTSLTPARRRVPLCRRGAERVGPRIGRPCSLQEQRAARSRCNVATPGSSCGFLRMRALRSRETIGYGCSQPEF